VPNNEFGDFQTPPALASKILQTLPHREWARVLEPTCGTGNFLNECAKVFQGSEIIGIEVQPGYVKEARLASAAVIEDDIFAINLSKDLPWTGVGPMLVLGNPPWVTNSQLSRLESDNRPKRVNLKNLSGYDAMTGSSNFDIAEYIWLKLIAELQHESPTISLLCKTQVARNVLEYCAKLKLPISAASLHIIDAKKWFGAAVDACLFTVEVSSGPVAYECDFYESLDADKPAHRFGVVDDRLVADIDSYKRSRWLDGACPLEWRQGMKHDAASVMELAHHDGGPRTRTGEVVEVEDEYVYPLLKCTDVFRGRLGLSKWVIVPQKAFNEDTQRLAGSAPKLWAYLNANAGVLDQRKSSIYRNRPRFCVFGLGAYSFAPYKVAISGLHKSAKFRLVGPIDSKPIFFDDACYLLPFENPCDAAVVAALLQTESARDFFHALAFWDAKRPITKKLLQRIDLPAIANHSEAIEIAEIARGLLEELENGEHYSQAILLAAVERLKDVWNKKDRTASDGAALTAGTLF
jgi:hypothetical protein